MFLNKVVQESKQAVVRQGRFGQSIWPLHFILRPIAIDLHEGEREEETGRKRNTTRIMKTICSVCLLLANVVLTVYLALKNGANKDGALHSTKFIHVVNIINQSVFATGIHFSFIYFCASKSRRRLWKALRRLENVSSFGDDFYSKPRCCSKLAVTTIFILVSKIFSYLCPNSSITPHHEMKGKLLH